MNKILSILFSRTKLILLLSVFVLGIGIYSYIVIPKQEMPDIDTPFMAIQVDAPGVSARYLEERVVSDMEQVILTFDDVMDVESTMYDHVAIIIILFSYQADNTDQLAVDIFTKLNDLELDDAVTEISYDSGFDDPHAIFSIHSDDVSTAELQALSESFKNKLLTIDDIASVELDNGYDEQIIITLNATLLSQYQLSITDIYNILYATNQSIPLGGISTVYGTITLASNDPFNSIEELEDIIIIPAIQGVTPIVRLNDIATISQEDTSNVQYTFDGESSVFVRLYFNEDIDFTVLGDEVLSVKQDFLESIDNDSIQIDEMLFLPDYVNTQINRVFTSLLIAIAVVMIVVLFGIGIRNSFLIILTIPVIILGTIGILYISGNELHKLTIVGLIVAIGIMVDNSIVITEGIKRHIDTGMDRTLSAKQGIKDNVYPILTSTLTTIAAFIVLVLLPGYLGVVVSSMPLTVIIALSLSFVVSMVLSPVLAILFLRPSKHKKTTESIHHTRIRTMIKNTIRLPFIWLLLAFGSLAIVTYLTFTRQPIDLYPNDERPFVYIDFEANTLHDKNETISLRNDILDLLPEQEKIVHTVTSVGGSLPHFHFSAPRLNQQDHVGRIFIELNMNEKEVTAYRDSLEQTLQTLQNGKATVHLLQLSPPEPPLQVMIKGSNSDTVQTMSTSLFDRIITMDEVGNYNIISSVESPKYVVSYYDDAIRNHYLTRAQIDEAIARNINGYDLEMILEDDTKTNIHIASTIASLEDVLDLSIYSATIDESNPLSTFISIETISDYVVIHHNGGKNVATIDLYPANGISLREMEDAVRDEISHHDTSGLQVQYGGENELFLDITDDLIRASIIALIMIFIILFVQFNDFRKPLIILLTIPLSFTGSFLFLLVFNVPITATALIGLISLMGVTVNTGILLVEYISKSEKTMDLKDACAEAVILRFRPIILTSLTTILGLIPLLLTGGSFFQPMAISFMGGMITSTLITIFLVPSAYTLLYRKKRA